MFPDEKIHPILIDFEKAHRKLPALRRNCARLESAVETYRKNYSSCIASIDEFVQIVDIETDMAEPRQPPNWNSAENQLSILSRLIDTITRTKESLAGQPLMRLEQNNTRLEVFVTILEAYTKFFQKR
ncbi:hypothetical protein C4J81_08840 [Deltaproteobacteria bacterium Smac51]|nr:hypothetical protein C4J81_08840 [Deltaproteobacteria bacterium Smac51]